MSFADPDRLGHRGERYYYNKKVTIYFSGADPADRASWELARRLGAAGIRERLGILTYSQLVGEATAAGERPGVYLRRRLRSLAGDQRCMESGDDLRL
jgi:hypothetical protein